MAKRTATKEAAGLKSLKSPEWDEGGREKGGEGGEREGSVFDSFFFF